MSFLHALLYSCHLPTVKFPRWEDMWSVIVYAIDEAIQQPGGTSDRDDSRHCSIAVVVPGIKARRPSLAQDNATLFCRCSLPPLPL